MLPYSSGNPSGDSSGSYTTPDRRPAGYVGRFFSATTRPAASAASPRQTASRRPVSASSSAASAPSCPHLLLPRQPTLASALSSLSASTLPTPRQTRQRPSARAASSADSTLLSTGHPQVCRPRRTFTASAVSHTRRTARPEPPSGAPAVRPAAARSPARRRAAVRAYGVRRRGAFGWGGGLAAAAAPETFAFGIGLRAIRFASSWAG